MSAKYKLNECVVSRAELENIEMEMYSWHTKLSKVMNVVAVEGTFGLKEGEYLCRWQGADKVFTEKQLCKIDLEPFCFVDFDDFYSEDEVE